MCEAVDPYCQVRANLKRDSMSEQLQHKIPPPHRSVQQLDLACEAIERQRAEHELAPYAGRLQTLAHSLVEAREDERRRLAQELHDRIGQDLTALDLNLNVIRGALPCEVSSQVLERLGECLRLVEHTAEIVSDLIAELRSMVPNDVGDAPTGGAVVPAHRHISGRVIARSPRRV